MGQISSELIVSHPPFGDDTLIFCEDTANNFLHLRLLFLCLEPSQVKN